MSQLRKDPFGPGWVIISPERGIEPSDFGSVNIKSSQSLLSPGNESFLGKELQALRPLGGSVNSPDWSVRVTEMPGALLQDKAFAVSNMGPFSCAPSSGYQELVIEHPDANMTLERMPKDHLRNVLMIYRDRLAYLAKQPNIKHIQLSRNRGRMAGSSFDHPHAQVLALPVSNRWVAEEQMAADSYFEANKNCLFCDVMQAELAAKERIVSHSDYFMAITPYASKTPFETWIMPKNHSSSFTSLAANVMSDLAELLQSVISSLNSVLDHPPYNLMLHTLKDEHDERYHWHIELLPRLTRQTGFDWSTGFYVNPTPPEDAARFLKEALMMQGVAL